MNIEMKRNVEVMRGNSKNKTDIINNLADHCL
jgi:hypothetical protein